MAPGLDPGERRFESSIPDQDIAKLESRLFWEEEIESSSLSILTKYYCMYGGIGIRVRLRNASRKGYRFNSCYVHKEYGGFDYTKGIYSSNCVIS